MEVKLYSKLQDEKKAKNTKAEHLSSSEIHTIHNESITANTWDAHEKAEVYLRNASLSDEEMWHHPKE